MPILTRRIDELLKNGNDIEITVLGVKVNQVRLGINAPDKINVVREELLDVGKNKKSPNFYSSDEHSSKYKCGGDNR